MKIVDIYIEFVNVLESVISTSTQHLLERGLTITADLTLLNDFACTIVQQNIGQSNRIESRLEK